MGERAILSPSRLVMLNGAYKLYFAWAAHGPASHSYALPAAHAAIVRLGWLYQSTPSSQATALPTSQPTPIPNIA